MNRLPTKQFVFLFIVIFGSTLANMNTLQDQQVIMMKGNIDRYQAVYELDEVPSRIDQVLSEDISSKPAVIDYRAFFNSFWISLFSILLIVAFYLRFFNSSDIRKYINHHLLAAGFRAKISFFRKVISVQNQFFIEMYGTTSLKIRFTMPYFDNYRDFGLRRYYNMTLTETNLSSLPLKLLIIKEYLNSN